MSQKLMIGYILTTMPNVIAIDGHIFIPRAKSTIPGIQVHPWVIQGNSHHQHCGFFCRIPVYQFWAQKKKTNWVSHPWNPSALLGSFIAILISIAGFICRITDKDSSNISFEHKIKIESVFPGIQVNFLVRPPECLTLNNLNVQTWMKVGQHISETRRNNQ